MTVPANAAADARADRRTILVALSVMLALVLFGVGFASFFASSNCRRLGPEVTAAVTEAARGADARELLVAAGVAPAALDAAAERHGALGSAVRLPFDAPLRIGDAPVGVAHVLVTGDGLALVDAAGDLTGAATFRRDVTVVGDGVAAFALVVGNTLTGQVDALRPLVPGVDGIAEGACVDTSAVGSPLSFLHDARGGQLVGLRTDEDGSEAVLELRDHVRGRVWAPPFALPRAPAGLQGSRTSGALGPDTVVVARRVADSDLASGSEPGPAVRAYARSDGTLRWAVEDAALRAVLPAPLAGAPTLRLEVAHVDGDRALVTVSPDVGPDADLPLPTFGPLGGLADADPAVVTVELDLATGAVRGVSDGASPVGRDGAERDALRRAFDDLGLPTTDAVTTSAGTWVLVGDVLARFGG